VWGHLQPVGVKPPQPPPPRQIERCSIAYTDIVHGRQSACIDPEVKRYKVKVTELLGGKNVASLRQPGILCSMHEGLVYTSSR